MVKKILDKDGRPNPFKDNHPGKDWWYAFLARNNLTIRSPSSLEIYRASVCTKHNLEHWYAMFEQFLSCHSLLDEPDRIWNCDESGFPLCPKSGLSIGSHWNKGSIFHLLCSERTNHYSCCDWSHVRVSRGLQEEADMQPVVLDMLGITSTC